MHIISVLYICCLLITNFGGAYIGIKVFEKPVLIWRSGVITLGINMVLLHLRRLL